MGDLIRAYFVYQTNLNLIFKKTYFFFKLLKCISKNIPAVYVWDYTI